MVVSLIGAPNTDRELIRWSLDALRKCGRMTKVKTGKVAFQPSLGDLERL